MFETYEDELGRIHNVSPEMLDAFMDKYPLAKKVDEMGKVIDSSTETQSVESDGTDSGSASGSSESQKPFEYDPDKNPDTLGVLR